ncbi:dynamin family protein [Coleofasciculus sp. FACHB-712]|uniref:dynamin family protein n=1 Tax=Coleofasciculus sp. FACHB-712 TaxID=2692789 RepID=UPI001682F7DE|nr:dynamin family protein [Coleofasciculus sp. FACHB-712]MBD1944459.1 dynamin family protein [Coleofasciculus sp. FACHB-712]
MDISLVSSEAVDLLSRITGQKLRKQDLTPPVIFLAALITVLLGVMLLDGTVTDEEKRRWQQTINRFIPSEYARQLSQLMSKGVRQNQVYKKLNELLMLTAPFSESERLLLIGFGYEMSAADGDMDAREKKYLEVIANRLEINPQHLAVLEAGFSHQGTVEPAALEEVQSLLDPARFHALDAVFIKAANDMLAVLPAKPKQQAKQQQRLSLSYEELQRFQGYRQQLKTASKQLAEIIQDGTNQGVLPNNLTAQVEQVSQKLSSQRFRVAVVGEFSQGKSTLLNALLGEEIQPVREIPCSGTVTVLRYGSQKRVICRYKDKREEEIPFEQYKIKAAISEEAALDCVSDELARSDIEEIIFEHPDLELCRSGVEIVDSPGLNEHPDRTAITQQLLKDTDAAIFLINASRPLTQGERDLIQDLKTQLNGGKTDKAAKNLFVVVNFMDLLRSENGRQQVRQRIERFVQGQNPIIAGENRLHFISAQATLDAIFAGSENDYLKTFQKFTKAVENFLITERGLIEFQQSTEGLKQLIEVSCDELNQFEQILEGKLKVSEEDKHKIFEEMGEASGRDVRIQLLAEQLIVKSCEQAEESWNEWAEGISDRITQKSNDWSSEYSHLWGQKDLIRDYADQFVRDLTKELDDWGNQKIRDSILKQNVEIIDNEIKQEIEYIRKRFQFFDRRLNTSLVNQLNVAAAETLGGLGAGGLGIASSINSDIGGAGGFFGGLGAGGLVAGALLIFTGLGIVPVILGGLAAAAGGSFGFGLLDVDGIHNQIKQKICDLGLEKFRQSEEAILGKIGKKIDSVFNDKADAASKAIAQAISISENLLEQQEKVHQETLEQREAEQVFIAEKRRELEQVQKNMEAILPC